MPPARFGKLAVVAKPSYTFLRITRNDAIDSKLAHALTELQVVVHEATHCSHTCSKRAHSSPL